MVYRQRDAVLTYPANTPKSQTPLFIQWDKRWETIPTEKAERSAQAARPHLLNGCGRAYQVIQLSIPKVVD